MKSTLRWLQRIGQSIPVIMILSIVVWSYYAFVVSLTSILPSPELKTFYLITYHAVFIIFVLSYLRIIFSNPGTVPPQFYLTAAEKEGLDSSADPRKFLEDVGSRLPVHETTLTNNVRYCEVCVCIKPDRAHHCSICRCCVLKMDHHCPWVNNCVGFRNYKYFTTFLMYSCVYCLMTALFVSPWALYIWSRVPELNNLSEITRFNIMILFFVAGMFFLSVLGLGVFHCYLTASNRSTLEMGRSPRFRDEVESGGGGRSGYDIGCRNNCLEVYGSGACILCPVYTSRGNGVLYPRDRTERGSSDMRRLLGSHGDSNDSDEDEEVVVYNGDIPLNLQPVP